MSTKIVLIFLSLILVFGCSSSNKGMEKLNSFWTRLISAGDSTAEHQAVQELHHYLKKEQISFEAFFETGNGQLLSLQDSAASAATSNPIAIKFYLGDDEDSLVKSNWKPKDVNNAYYLYHE